tara:strand:+ start:2104 stop:2301 length:198 start_codon:yes stop_codon:yes gene_type:complete
LIAPVAALVAYDYLPGDIPGGLSINFFSGLPVAILDACCNPFNSGSGLFFGVFHLPPFLGFFFFL